MEEEYTDSGLGFSLEEILPTHEEIECYAKMWDTEGVLKLNNLVLPEHDEILADYENSCEELNIDSISLFQSLLKSRMFFEAIKHKQKFENLGDYSNE